MANTTLCCVPEAMNVLEVKFIGDGDALEHIVDKQEGKDRSHFAPPVEVCVLESG